MKIEAEEVFQSFQGRNWTGALGGRDRFVRKYAWAVPNMAAINEIARLGRLSRLELERATGLTFFVRRV